MNIPKFKILTFLVLSLSLSITNFAQDHSKEHEVNIIKDLSYAKGDNPRQQLDLFLPKIDEGNQKTLPVIVYIHGGAWRSGEKSRGYNKLRKFVSAGQYAGVTINYRLSQEAKWPAQLHDCKAAIRWIRANAKKYNLDPNKIAVWGSSAGGHLVAMLGVTSKVAVDLEGKVGPHTDQKSDVTCVVNFFGPSDFLKMNDFPSRIDHDSPRSPESQLIGGAIQENKEKVATANPLTYISSQAAPSLIVHGTKDPLVPFNQSEILYKKLKAHKVEVELHAVKDGGHGFRDREVNRKVAAFIKTHLIDRKSPKEKPNVLFIAVDDLNHWIGHLKRNPQTITPNLDRLASWGVSFERAYCIAPACNPSRAALMSGMRPSTTGIYLNPNPYKPYIRPEQTLNSHFRANGYYVAGAGKIYHGGGGRREEWDDYGSQKGVTKSLGAHKRGGVGKLAWAQLKGGDDQVKDYHTVSYCLEQLNRKHDKPFFLACGIFRPHLPWNVPKKYFDLHPLDKIKLPPYQKDDLEDLPPAGVKMARPQGDHAQVLKADHWKELIRAYLASVSYADAQLGRLLDGIEKSSYKDNTVIVLWGDHGWHLGEKHHWRKFALWEEATRAPLIWVAPGVTPKNVTSKRTVDFLSIYPTLCDLTQLPKPTHVEGASILTLLKNPNAPWDRPAMTTHGFKNHSLRTQKWRYIRYANGDEELYDHEKDPYEWQNLASLPQYAEVKNKLGKWLPKKDQPEVERKNPNKKNQKNKKRRKKAAQ